jgi:hypothetical protein
MAKFAMARSAIAVIRFMTFSPFHEASTLIAFNLLSGVHWGKGPHNAKLFLGDVSVPG